MELDHATKRRFVVVLGLMTAMGATAVDMSLAAFPEMAAALDTSIAAGQHVVGIFVLGMGLGQIPAGLMADRVGRLPVIYVGVSLFTLAGVATAVANSIEFLIVARFVQGLGASVSMVVARAMVRDMASKQEAARMLSVMAMVFTIAPMLAPIVGGYLVVHIGWRAPFAAVALFGLIVLALAAVVLRETGQARKDSHPLKQFAMSFGEFVSYRRSIFAAALIILTAMGYMTVISGASALIIEIYGFSTEQFGFIFATAGLTILVASWINRAVLLRVNVLQAVGLGALLVGLGGAGLLVAAWSGALPFWFVWGSVCLYLSGFSFLFANATAMALDPLPNTAGVASSIIGSIQHSLSSLSAMVAGMLYDGTLAASVTMMGAFGVSVLLLFLARNVLLRETGRLFVKQQ